MKLTCTKTFFKFIKGEEYLFEIKNSPVLLLTNYHRYWEINHNLLSGQFKSIKQKLKSEKKSYEVEINLPHALFKLDNSPICKFLISTDNEILKLGVDKDYNNNIAFGPVAIYRIDDYFDFKSERRNIQLDKLGIE